jgi:hypothetical protein
MADNRPDEALELIQQGMNLVPSHAELLYRLSCYHYILGNINESYRVLADALATNTSQSNSIFEYTPAMNNDIHIHELIEIYKNHL